jgi:hypothetical protein
MKESYRGERRRKHGRSDRVNFSLKIPTESSERFINSKEPSGTEAKIGSERI